MAPLAARKPAPWAPVTLADAWHEAVSAASDSGPKPLTQYQRDPVGFLVDVLGIHPQTIRWSTHPAYAAYEWDGTQDPLAFALEEIARFGWVGVSSGTGTGKTFLMAAALLWWIAVWPDAIATTVATKEDQMEKGVWKEISAMFPRFKQAFPAAELTHLRIRMRPGVDTWAAWGITAKPSADATSNTGVQGLHAPYLLILVDEMPGVDPSIITALENTATDPCNVIAGFGNPDNATDPLAKFCGKANVAAIRISGLDHPNVVTGQTLVPGAVSRHSIERRASDVGEESPMFKSRVRGIAPEQASDALIHRAWVDAAILRGKMWLAAKALEQYPYAFGVDPSNSDGGDEAAVSRWRGPLCEHVKSNPCPNANDLGAKVWIEAQALGVDARAIGVDPIGVGAGTVNEMRRLGATPSALNGGGGPKARVQKSGDGEPLAWDANQFLNLRAQMYWQLREDLRRGLVGLPDDPALVEELIMPTYEVRNGKVVIEPKDDIKRRLGRSPNRADAVVYGNFVRPRTKPLPPVANLEHHHAGWTGTGKKVRPVRPEDLAPARPGRDAAVQKWWSGWGAR